MTRSEGTGTPPRRDDVREGHLLAGLVLLLVGGVLVFLFTFFTASIDLKQGSWSGLPAIGVTYWAVLNPASLAAVPAFDRWLWIADAIVTLLCVATAVWAAVALGTRRAPAWWATLTLGTLALLVFIIEIVDYVRQGVLAPGLLVSALGATAVVVGSILLATGSAADSMR